MKKSNTFVIIIFGVYTFLILLLNVSNKFSTYFINNIIYLLSKMNVGYDYLDLISKIIYYFILYIPYGAIVFSFSANVFEKKLYVFAFTILCILFVVLISTLIQSIKYEYDALVPILKISFSYIGFLVSYLSLYIRVNKKNKKN